MNDPEHDRWPSVTEAPERDMCPMCEALTTEPHGSTCPLYLPFCPRCATRPTEVDGDICRKCQAEIRRGAA